jgi:cysteine desulfurase
VHAPQGVGFAYVDSRLKMEPLLTGGEQEFGRRAGTENVLGILALGKAVEILRLRGSLFYANMEMLRNSFESRIKEIFPDVIIHGQGKRVTNVSNMAFPGIDGETLLINLDRAGIAASHGSACSSGALEPSRVLLNMGIPVNTVRSSMRFSLSRFTTQLEIDRSCEILVKEVKNLR